MICGTAAGPCTATLITRNSHGRPAALGVGEHVALGGAGPPGDQPDPAGQERQPPLAARVEQPLGGEQLLQLLEPGQQLAEADLADLVGAQGQRAPGGVELGLGVHHDPGALGQRRARRRRARRGGR